MVFSRFGSSFIKPLDIPNLDLGRSAVHDENDPASPAMSVSSTGAVGSGPPSRRTSISSSSRPGTSMSQRSRSSSRSTSFNLPNNSSEKLSSDELEVPLMDEEGMLSPPDPPPP